MATRNSVYPPAPQPPSSSAGGGAPIAGTTQGSTYYPSVPKGMRPPGTSGGTGMGGAGAVTGAGLNRQDFIQSYANMVARCWVDDSYLQLVLSNPVDTLASAGMPTVDGAIIRVIEHKITGSGKIEDQVDAWLEGNNTGLYNLYLPMKPDEFDVTAGGGGNSCAGGDSCCCCPCCCCT